MTILDAVHERACAASRGRPDLKISVKSSLTPPDRKNRSISLNLISAGGAEILDLIVWESGECEAIMEAEDGELIPIHIDNISTIDQIDDLIDAAISNWLKGTHLRGGNPT